MMRAVLGHPRVHPAPTTMAALLCAGALLAAGCAESLQDPDEGIAVGNPSLTALRLAETDGIDTLVEARLSVARVDVALPDGSTNPLAELDGKEPFDLNVGGTLGLPQIELEGLTLVPDGPFTLRAELAGGGSLDAELTLGNLALIPAGGADAADTMIIDQPTLVLELGNPAWLTDVPGLDATAETTVRPGDALHDVLRERLVQASALYPDLNGNTHTDPDERDQPMAESAE